MVNSVMTLTTVEKTIDECLCETACMALFFKGETRKIKRVKVDQLAWNRVAAAAANLLYSRSYGSIYAFPSLQSCC